VILVTKEEKFAILKKCPNAHFVRTMMQKSKRHRYWMAEDFLPMKHLRELRAPQNLQYAK